jgi:hypothetical protein
VDESVKVCVDDELTLTLPKATLLALMLSVAVPVVVLSCRANVFETLFAVAVSVTDCAVENDETVAVNVALVAPAATVTVDGTVTAELLLVRLTLTPPLAAAAFSVTVHESVPAPVIDDLEQFRALNTGTPVPLKLTVEVLPLEELLEIVN